MQPKDYTDWTEELSVYPTEDCRGDIAVILYLAVALNEEAGEVAGKIKKFYRDGDLTHSDVAYELGDVLFYLTRMAVSMGYTLQDIIDMNVSKLEDRQRRGVIHGSGDAR